MNRFW